MYNVRYLCLVILFAFDIWSADNKLEFFGPFDKKNRVMEFFQLNQIGQRGPNVEFQLIHMIYASVDCLRLDAQCKGAWKVAFTQKELGVIKSSSGKHLEQDTWNIVKKLMEVAKVSLAIHAEMPLHK